MQNFFSFCTLIFSCHFAKKCFLSPHCNFLRRGNEETEGQNSTVYVYPLPVLLPIPIEIDMTQYKFFGSMSTSSLNNHNYYSLNYMLCCYTHCGTSRSIVSKIFRFFRVDHI